MNLNKKNLYKEIQKYIYDNTFADLNVFSKQYFHCIVSPCYSDNTKNYPYSIISIDFNNMQEINKNGLQRGDEILHDSISIMQSVLPENSYTIRLGGDEFLFFLNGVSRENAKIIEKQMHIKMTEAAKQIDGTTMTSYSVFSESANNIDSLIEIADTAITAIKQDSKIPDSLNDWDILKEKAKENFSSFFKTLRFHNFPLEPEHIQRILMYATNSYDNLISDSKENDEEEINFNENNINNTIYCIEDLKNLHHLLADSKDGEINYELLDSFNVETLASILDSMVRDPITLQFAEPYFKKFLLDECNCEFKALKISPVFVKLSNTLNSSHQLTNIQIEKNQRRLYCFLNNRIDFNQDTYTNYPLNYMVSLSGGDMLLALDPQTTLKVEDIKEFLESSYSSEFFQDNLLRYVVADNFSFLNKDNFSKVFFAQTDECNKNKIPLIDSMLNDDLVQDLLDISLKDTTTFYKKLVPNANDITAKSKYMNMLSKTFLDIYSTLDVAHDEEMLNKKTSKGDFIPKVNIDYSKINYKKSIDSNSKTIEKDQDENIL